MSAEMAQKLVQGGIKAVRSGDHDLARKAFTQALKLDPNNEAAWLGMATITEGSTAKLRILKRVLEINPDSARAKEAIRRIAGEAKVAKAPPEPESPAMVEPEPEPEIEQETMVASDLFADDDDEDMASEPESEESPVAEDEDIFATGEIPPLTDMPAGDTGQLSDFPEPDWALDEDVPGVDTSKPPVPELVIRSSGDVFSNMPSIPSRGSGGVPILPPTAIEAESEGKEEEIQAYLENMLATYLEPERPFVRKERGRVGSTEYRTFLLQAGAAAFVAIVIVFGGLGTAILTNPAARRVLFAATWTPSPTPTNTPTPTPGVTNTPSPTPPVPPTQTPALPGGAPLAFDDPNFPPTPTEAYYPDTNAALSVPDELFVFINNGELDQAGELLSTAVFVEEETGAFPPVYRLSQWHLLNDDPRDARAVLEEWRAEWEERDPSLYLNSESLYLIAQSRVDLYEARNGGEDRFGLLDTAQVNLERALGLSDEPIPVFDATNAEGYVLLAEVLQERGNSARALEVIEQGLEQRFQNRWLISNTELRMAAARILVAGRRFDEALQQLYFALEFNPFLEEALILQTEIALESGQPGLAVLYAEQYLLYYPGSLQGLYLLGQAREAENKFDLALNAYSRAVAGDTDIEEYVSDPFFLDNLLARATLLTRQGQRQEAADDFSLALELTGDNPAIRARSIASFYVAGEYDTVVSEAEALSGVRGVDQSEVQYYLGLSLIELSQAGQGNNYSEASDALVRAINEGLPGTLRAIAEENLAFALFQQGRYDAALEAIDNALEDRFTAERVFLRGQILEGQGDVEAALLDYEFLVTWGEYFNFPFLEEVRNSYQSALNRAGLR